jgi:predicted anti-sigma-YlaC factor YlaD
MLEFAPPNDCLQAREAVSARLDGELTELEAARLEGHLRQCAACRAFAHDVAAATAGLRATPLEPVAARAFVAHGRRFHSPAAAAVAAAALLVAAAAPSFFAGKLFADHAGGHTVTVFAAGPGTAVLGLPERGIDPGIVALLVGQGAGSGRIIPV